MVDDLGYGDLQSFGNLEQEFNPVDQLIREGIRFTNAYSADSMCSPARAGFMTGRLPIRLGVTGGNRVFMIYDTGGLPKEDPTIAEMLKTYGYNTGMAGKWHLGINEKNYSDGNHLPGRRGFDFVGINLPYTLIWECDETGELYPGGPDQDRCFVYKGDKIVQHPTTYSNFTAEMLADWRYFLKNNAMPTINTKPFFYFHSFPHVHVAQFANKDFKGKSVRGIFGDNLNEMAWYVGQVIQDLRMNRINLNTLVVFLSDHGPHQELCNNGGATAGLKGGKSNTFEGGFRIPMAAWMPGSIFPGQVSHEVISAMDLYPTFERLASKPEARNPFYVPPSKQETRKMDGVDIWPQLVGLSATNNFKNISLTPLIERRPIFFYCNEKLLAIRAGKYKVHYMTQLIFRDNVSSVQENCPGGKPKKEWFVSFFCPDEELVKHDPPLIYDLEKDPYEVYPIVDDATIKTVTDKASKLINDHRQSIVPVKQQLGDFDDCVWPCYGDNCGCDS
ncbi:hypothetical protein ACQ4LE_010179 [Meloidogyne hapla]